MNDDASLIDQTLAGQSAAFGELVRRYQDRLYHTLVHVVGHAEDAKDIAQEAFVQAFVKLDTFRRQSAFYTWLYRIAFHVAASHQRRRRPRATIDHDRDTPGIDPVDPTAGPAEEIEARERGRQVRAALNTLSEEYRTILVLREMDGCCYETIAEILDLPIGTVRSRLHRARLQLHERLIDVLRIEEPERTKLKR